MNRGGGFAAIIIGDAVNTPLQIEGYTKEVLARQLAQTGDDGRPGAAILITQATYSQIKNFVECAANSFGLPKCATISAEK